MKKQKHYNHLVDVAFSVEGPWKNFDDIPLFDLIEALKRRAEYLSRNPHDAVEAFGNCGDCYEVKFPRS
jgi:hypothetical protein